MTIDLRGEATPSDAMAAIKEAKSKAKAPWWSLLKPEYELIEHPTFGSVNCARLQCTECKEFFSITNPSSTAECHFLDYKTKPRCKENVKKQNQMAASLEMVSQRCLSSLSQRCNIYNLKTGPSKTLSLCCRRSPLEFYARHNLCV